MQRVKIKSGVNVRSEKQCFTYPEMVDFFWQGIFQQKVHRNRRTAGKVFYFFSETCFNRFFVAYQLVQFVLIRQYAV